MEFSIDTKTLTNKLATKHKVTGLMDELVLTCEKVDKDSIMMQANIVLADYSLCVHDYQVSIKRYLKAIEYFEITEDNGLYLYERLGKCYALTKEYEKSIAAYKRCLEQAWVDKNEEFELRVYRALSF